MNDRILLIEDNMAIASSIKTKLFEENYQVNIASDGKLALDEFYKSEYDLVLLDLMLPQLSGEDVLFNIRKKSDVPIIIISMKSSDIEKAINLGSGADDYLSKPFSMLELIARIKANLRRYRLAHKVEEHQMIQLGDLRVDLDNYTVQREQEVINLTVKEFQILKILIDQRHRVVLKDELYYRIWKDDGIRSENVINVHMKNLRDKIETDPTNPKHILTVRGYGYRIGNMSILNNTRG